MSELCVTIYGVPSPKGSLAYKGRNKTTGAPVMTETLAASKPWRDRVTAALLEHPDRRCHTRGTPLAIEATFTFPRPAAHYGTGRNTDQVKPSAPTHPTGHNIGDGDKLLRNICDACQDAGIVVDDAQFVALTARKTYPGGDMPDALDHPGAIIRIYPLRSP